MITLDVDREDLRCAGFRAADGEWSLKAIERTVDPDAADRHEALAAPAPLPDRIDQDIAVVRAAIAAGLSVGSATIGGVNLQLNETAPPAPTRQPQSVQASSAPAF